MPLSSFFLRISSGRLFKTVSRISGTQTLITIEIKYNQSAMSYEHSVEKYIYIYIYTTPKYNIFVDLTYCIIRIAFRLQS